MAEKGGKDSLIITILLYYPILGMQGTFLVLLTYNSPKMGDKPLLKPVNVENMYWYQKRGLTGSEARHGCVT
jgi:hypothetical protein